MKSTQEKSLAEQPSSASAYGDLTILYGTEAILPFNPIHELREMLAKDGDLNAKTLRAASIDYQLLTLWNVHRLTVSTTSLGDGGHLLWIVSQALCSKDTSQRPLDQLFHVLKSVTILAEEVMKDKKEAEQDSNVAKLYAQSHRAIHLLQLLSSVPDLQTIRVHGLHLTQATAGPAGTSPHIFDLTLWPEKITAPTITLKRCCVRTEIIIELIQRAIDVQSFIYDYSPPHRIWRPCHLHESVKDSNPPEQLDPAEVWNPGAIIDASKRTNAVNTLHTLDFSSLMAQLPFHRPGFQVTDLRAFTSLRFIGLKNASLPTCSQENAQSGDSNEPIRQVPLHDFLPPSIAKIHLCGHLSAKAANELFGPYLPPASDQSDRAHLPNIKQLVIDHAPFNPLKVNALGPASIEIDQEERYYRPRYGTVGDSAAVWEYPETNLGQVRPGFGKSMWTAKLKQSPLVTL